VSTRGRLLTKIDRRAAEFDPFMRIDPSGHNSGDKVKPAKSRLMVSNPPSRRSQVLQRVIGLSEEASRITKGSTRQQGLIRFKQTSANSGIAEMLEDPLSRAEPHIIPIRMGQRPVDPVADVAR